MRVKNKDRYDDRLRVETNLIESFGILMEFIARHTNDPFFLIDNQNVSVRSHIAREIVSNILVHREFSGTFPARIIIEENRLVAENWNRALRYGHLDPENFEPWLIEHEWITNADARRITDKAEGSVKRFLHNLAEKGFLEIRGKNRSRRYRLCKE